MCDLLLVSPVFHNRLGFTDNYVGLSVSWIIAYRKKHARRVKINIMRDAFTRCVNYFSVTTTH